MPFQINSLICYLSIIWNLINFSYSLVRAAMQFSAKQFVNTRKEEEEEAVEFSDMSDIFCTRFTVGSIGRTTQWKSFQCHVTVDSSF